MDEKAKPLKSSNGGFSDAEMKQGHRVLSTVDVTRPDGNDGESEYKPGQQKNDSDQRGTAKSKGSDPDGDNE